MRCDIIMRSQENTTKADKAATMLLNSGKKTTFIAAKKLNRILWDKMSDVIQIANLKDIAY